MRVVGVVVRQFFGGKVIDGNGGGDSLGGLSKLCGFAVIDQALLACQVDIVNARFIHSIVQRLDCSSEFKSSFQPRQTVVIFRMEEVDG